MAQANALSTAFPVVPAMIGRVEAFSGQADHVDDRTAAPSPHATTVLSGQVDVAEYLQIPRFAPARILDLIDRAARNRTGMVHRNVDFAAAFRQRFGRSAHRQIQCVNLRAHLMGRTNLLTPPLEKIRIPRHENQIRSFRGKPFGATEPNAPGRSGHRHCLALKSQIHETPPGLPAALRTGITVTLRPRDTPVAPISQVRWGPVGMEAPS